MREHYLLADDIIFLNHGSFGACPKPVFEQYQAWQLELERQPVEFLGRRHDTLIRDALAQLGDFLGTSGDNLVFVPNATTGLNMIARSLKLSAEDEILTTDHEYGALNLTWQYISQQTDCQVKVMPLPDYLSDAEAVADSIWQGVTKHTKILFLSHITSPTALILPVEILCQRAREAGIITIIDGAHVPGHLKLDLDVLDADFYSGNCHKWLSAPKGSAFVYIRPEHHALIDPLTISWGWDGDTLFERTRWQGTREIASFLTVPTAIDFHKEHDWWTLSEQCHQLAIATGERISHMTKLQPLATDDFFAQMIAIPLPSESDIVHLKNYLYDQHRIEVPLTSHAERKFVRVSIQAYNTQSDVDMLVNAIEAYYAD
ncbi:MAG: aminotransferase class V-fold PLP-dependent enzyme [Chloroflexota bacterium]